MNNKVKLITALIFIVGLEIIVTYIYFTTFNGDVSSDTDKWELFLQLFNGLIISILTAINIYIFNKISLNIDNNNNQRTIKAQLFEVQRTITNMRIKQYEEIRAIVSEIKIDLFTYHVINERNIEIFYKKIKEMSESFLFKKDLNEKSYVFYMGENIIKEIEHQKEIAIQQDINNNFQIKDFQKIHDLLTDYIETLEFYILGQMLADDEINEYINKKGRFIDTTISCINKFATELDEISKSSLKKFLEKNHH